MRLVTWNINSLRLRLDLLRRLIREEQPDVICLQEIKVEDSAFPEEELKGMGYPHIRKRCFDTLVDSERLPVM